eukprot:7931182-Lingulodinium_polyedra.AAC.1
MADRLRSGRGAALRRLGGHTGDARVGGTAAELCGVHCLSRAHSCPDRQAQAHMCTFRCACPR